MSQLEGVECAPSGLTRLMFELMDQKISQAVLSEMTGIPKPTLSQYANGVREISRTHLPVLAVALGVTPPTSLRAPLTENYCIVVENEWSDTNPFYYHRNYTTRSMYMDPNNLFRYRTK